MVTTHKNPSPLVISVGRDRHPEQTESRVSPSLTPIYLGPSPARPVIGLSGARLRSWVSAHRKFLSGLAGGLCVLGLTLAMWPTSPAATVYKAEPSEPVVTSHTADITQPEATANSQALAHGTVSDPRAFVMEHVLSGDIGFDVSGWNQVDASVTSRNGDIVLVTVSGMSADGIAHTVGVLLVATDEKWIVREVYSNDIGPSAQ